MNSKIATIGLFGILVVAAFAGIALVADEGYADPEAGGDSNPEQTEGVETQDAEEEEDEQPSVTTTVLQYTVGTTVYSVTVPAGDTTVTLKDLAALGYTIADGKTFRGWSTENVESPSTIYSAGSTYDVSNGPNVLYAVIDSVTYKVTFSYVDGTSILFQDDLAYDATLTLPAKATSVDAGKVLEFDESVGMIFVGWVLADDLETIVIAASEETVKVVGNVDYVAAYVHDPVLTFVVDGTQTYKHTEYGAVLPTAPSKDGFSFVGWSDGELTVRDKELSTYVALLVDDVTLTAVWEPAVYTVSFVVDGETVLTQSVKHGETATEPKIVPAKDGFDFTAWTVGDVAYDFGSAVTGDLTVTASFEAVPAPAPTGLKDPMTQMLLIIIGTLVLALIAVVLWKRDVIRAGLVKRLDKGDKGNGGDGTA